MDTPNAAIPATPSVTSVIQQVPVDQIKPSRHQARKDFDEEGIRQLAVSIDKEDLIQPITLRKVGDGYEVISGERRLRAVKSLGRPTIEARVIEVVNEAAASAKGLVENVQRRDLNPIEEAEAFDNQKKLDSTYWTQEKIAEVVGKDRTYVTKSIALLSLPEKIIADVRQRTLTREHGIELLRLNNAKEQKRLAHKVGKKGLTVLQTRAIIDKKLGIGTANGNKGAIVKKLAQEALKGYVPGATSDPVAEIWDKAQKDHDMLRYGDWAAAYGCRDSLALPARELSPGTEGWAIWIERNSDEPQKILAGWFAAMAKRLGYNPEDKIYQEQKWEEIPQESEPEQPAEKPVQLKLRLPQSPEEEAELREIAAASKGPSPIYAWVLGKHHDMTETTKILRWKDLGAKDGAEALPKVLENLKQLQKKLANIGKDS